VESVLLEAKDGYDTVEWAAAQPWSNGKVGMHGGSYLGHVQWQAASLAPPHLVTIFPTLASTSIYHNTLYHAARSNSRLPWAGVQCECRFAS